MQSQFTESSFASDIFDICKVSYQWICNEYSTCDMTRNFALTSSGQFSRGGGRTETIEIRPLRPNQATILPGVGVKGKGVKLEVSFESTTKNKIFFSLKWVKKSKKSIKQWKSNQPIFQLCVLLAKEIQTLNCIWTIRNHCCQLVSYRILVQGPFK